MTSRPPSMRPKAAGPAAMLVVISVRICAAAGTWPRRRDAARRSIRLHEGGRPHAAGGNSKRPQFAPEAEARAKERGSSRGGRQGRRSA
eukprot:2692275-Prymnesium_polylepis.1